jgi:UDP-2,3-diacylglucosamine pyrophosphatase LpxH
MHSHSGEDEHAPGFCGDLFQHTRKLFNALPVPSDPDSDEAFLAHNEAGRFRLWGDGFDVLDGGLDKLLESSPLRSAVVEQLVEMSRTLSRCVFPRVYKVTSCGCIDKGQM